MCACDLTHSSGQPAPRNPGRSQARLSQTSISVEGSGSERAVSRRPAAAVSKGTTNPSRTVLDRAAPRRSNAAAARGRRLDPKRVEGGMAVETRYEATVEGRWAGGRVPLEAS